jgi:hypothetical protein
MEELQGQQGEEHPMEEDPALPYALAEPKVRTIFTTSTLQVLLEEPASSTQLPELTPTSVVESIPSSEVVSATYSSTPDIAALQVHSWHSALTKLLRTIYTTSFIVASHPSCCRK